MEWLTNQKSTKKDAQLDFAGASGGGAVGQESAGADWYPRRKLTVVKWKLDGHNPAKILSLELRENKQMQMDSKLMDKCVAHLRGELTHKRARDFDKISEPAEQVELILDLAKDPNILGRTWVGWGSAHAEHTLRRAAAGTATHAGAHPGCALVLYRAFSPMT